MMVYQRWEYQAISIDAFDSRSSIAYSLNEYGNRGWELATCWVNILIFKRPVEPVPVAPPPSYEEIKTTGRLGPD